MASLVQPRQINPTLLSAARFAVVGLLGTLLDFTLFSVLQAAFHLPALAASTISYSAGIANNFILHRAWTFAVRPRRPARRQFLQFAAVSLTALALNNLVVFVLVPPFSAYLPNPFLAAALAKLCATAAGVAWNFCANHFWTFRE